LLKYKMIKPRKIITLDSYIRDLPWSLFNFIANELDSPGSSTNWKDFVTKIPISLNNSTPRFSMNEIRKFETLAYRGESPTIAVMDAWGTYNCTVKDLLSVLELLNLHSSADKVKKLMPQLPKYEEISSSCILPSTSRRPVEHTSFHETTNSVFKENVSTTKECSSFSDEGLSKLSEDYLQSITTDNFKIQHYQYSHMLQITRNFNEVFKLGEGAFGSVYKGIILNKIPPYKSTIVAIKRLKLDNQHNKVLLANQFKKEIETISELSHPNILSILGFSCDGPQWCLMYHFMVNGSLSHNLQLSREEKKELSMFERLKILKESSLGIQYLHRKSLIHRDIKSSNILLDADMNLRIGDFGLIRKNGQESTNLTDNHSGTMVTDMTGNPVGTMVYMAPESMLGKISPAMDVYSFGIVILEVVTNLKVMDETRQPNHIVLYCDEIDDVIHSSMAPLCGEKLLEIAEECLNHKYKKRAKIDQVLEDLTNMLQTFTDNKSD